MPNFASNHRNNIFDRKLLNYGIRKPDRVPEEPLNKDVEMGGARRISGLVNVLHLKLASSGERENRRPQATFRNGCPFETPQKDVLG
jgi:hypothetical protein